MGKPSDLIQGTLDLLILKTVALEPKHGWAIGKRIEQISKDVLQVTQGSLYPALHRLEQQGWLRGPGGRDRLGTRGEVLRADGGRPDAARPRAGKLGAALDGNRPRRVREAE